MLKTFKNVILVGLASLILIACQQQGGGGNSKKSKTLENTQKRFCKMWCISRSTRIFKC